MIMEKEAKQQICSKLCSNLGTFLPIIMFLVLFSFFFFFSSSASYSFPFLLTIPIALLSTMFLVTLTKKNGSQDENLVQDKLQKEEPQLQLQLQLQPSLDVTLIEVNQQSETDESYEQQAEAHSDSSFPSIMDKTFEFIAQKHEQQADSQSDCSPSSDSEGSTGSIMDQNFEIDHNKYQNVGISDSLASENDDDDDDDEDYDEEEEEEEEDSLIEINLPRRHSSSLSGEPKQKLESNLPEFLQESIFKRQVLMELLAEINEMNEDENLIEIDISKGSTECHDLRLKQELAHLGGQCIPTD